MELKYIWIKNFKNLKEIGFNINHSGEEKFDFKNGDIIITESTSQQPNNFFGKNYNGITAVVGKNGSGKTNLTEFINYNLSHVTNGGLSTWIKSEGLLIIDNWIFVQQDIIIKNEKYLKSIGYTISKFENAPLDNGQGEMRWHKMEKNKYIYYCPLFDQRMIKVHDNLVNISTTYLVYNDLYNSRKSHINYDGNKRTKYASTNLDSHYKMELTRQAELALYYEKISNYIDFIPDKILIGIDHESENSLLTWEWKDEETGDYQEIQAKLLNKYNKELDQLESYQLNQFKDYLSQKSEKSSLEKYKIPSNIKKDTFYRLFFLRMFRVLMNYEKVIFPEDYFRNFIYDETIVHLEDRTTQQRLISLKQDLKMLIESAIWEEKEEKYNNSAYSSREELKQEIAINDFFRNLILNISKIETKNLLLKIIGQSKELLNGISILHYELLGEYSSGQQLLLSFYSRFLYAKNEILENEKYEFGISGETIIIFIDEGETSLHPEWQRVYFERMRTYLSDLFKDYTIQLILISHSPFVISDIPKENILFLTKDENGNANQIEIDTDETFGANIHELLINSFFMKSSMGEFVENKIKKIINFYYQVIENQSVESLIKLKREYQDYKLEFQYIVNSVGDEIIRNILTNHIESIEKKLFPKNYVDIRINELEEELKHLKLRKK